MILAAIFFLFLLLHHLVTFINCRLRNQAVRQNFSMFWYLEAQLLFLQNKTLKPSIFSWVRCGKQNEHLLLFA